MRRLALLIGLGCQAAIGEGSIPADLARAIDELEALADDARREARLGDAIAYEHDAAWSLFGAGFDGDAAEHAVHALELLAAAGRPAELLELATATLACIERASSPGAQARVRARLGQALRALGRIDEATIELESAARRACDDGDDETWLFSSHELAWCLKDRGRLHEALALFEQCAERALARGDVSALARATRAQGNMLIVLRRPNEARERMNCALAWCLEAGELGRAAETELHLADLERIEGRHDDALATLARADAALARLAHSDPAATALHWSDLAERRLVLEHRVHRARDREPPAWLLDRMLAELDDPFVLHADAELRSALIGQLRLRGEIGRALAISEELVATARELGHGLRLTLPLCELAACKWQLGEHEAALEHVVEALTCRDSELASLEDVEIEAHLARGRTQTTVARLGLCIAADAWRRDRDGSVADLALAFVDSVRGRALMARASSAGRGPLDAAALPVRDRGRALRAGLAVDELLVAFDLPSQVAVVCTRERAELVELPPAADVERQIDLARFALWELRDDVRFERSARRLSEMLVRPLERWLERASKITCVPDGALCDLPFELLLDPRVERTTQGFAGLPFLFRRHVVVHAPALAQLAHREPRRRSDDALRLTLFAYAAAPLPGAADETEAIAALWPVDRALVLEGDQATEARFRQLANAGADVLHVAAHAFADRDGAREPAVELASGDGCDGRLTCSEILRLHAPVELVVLAGCDSGSGPVGAGEGVMSLGWALLCSGARSVVVTVSPIEDRRAIELFVPFYREFLATGDPALALQRARLERIDRDDGGFAACQPFEVLRGVR